MLKDGIDSAHLICSWCHSSPALGGDACSKVYSLGAQYPRPTLPRIGNILSGYFCSNSFDVRDFCGS
jgi:hypothetical protein